MTDDKGYQGWANYPTWAMSLWIDNEEASYEYSREMAREVLHDDEPPKVLLADMLKSWMEESNPLADSASVWTDLLGYAFEQIDWQEIAANYLEEVQES